jgi:hypothetical protein
VYGCATRMPYSDVPSEIGSGVRWTRRRGSKIEGENGWRRRMDRGWRRGKENRSEVNWSVEAKAGN